MAMFASGFGIVVMTAVADAPGNSLYYAGLFLVVVYGATLVRLRWTRSALVSLMLVALYAISASWVNPLPVNVLANNIFFLGAAVVTGIFTSYLQEFLIRRDFASAEMLMLEKTRAVQLLAAANAANKAKGDFLAIVSHELRTPLNAILGFSEVMQRRMFGPIGSERYIGYIDDIHNAADHLLNIVTDILDLSKAEVGKLSLSEDNISLSEVVDQCCRLVREKAAEGSLALEIVPIAEPALLRADSRLVKQVFINLLSNAIKFTDPGGDVTVSMARAGDGGWTVSFADSGVGIAEDDLKRILEPFVQVESAFARKRGGAGLGLPLAKKVMELHGGTLTVASQLGVGTTVSVHFPAARTLPAEEKMYGVA
jgi:signal transduction histidine kinase